MKFTWDHTKERKVKDEHKIEFGKIKDVFDDPFAIEFTDESHSADDEVRFAIIGLTAEYGLIHLVFTETTETELHFITARKAEKWMVDAYEENRRRI